MKLKSKNLYSKLNGWMTRSLMVFCLSCRNIINAWFTEAGKKCFIAKALSSKRLEELWCILLFARQICLGLSVYLHQCMCMIVMQICFSYWKDFRISNNRSFSDNLEPFRNEKCSPPFVPTMVGPAEDTELNKSINISFSCKSISFVN